jgi:chain length determinant protein (polysaccharide antigen chain regulator)
LQEKIAYLKDIKINPESVRVVRVDQIAEVPVSPVKPKKALIVAVAAVLGLMLGVFIALIRQAVKKRKAAQAEAVSAS